LPLLTLGMFLLFRVFSEPAGKGMNSLLALAGIMLILFAISFHAASVFG
jgi:hypothetical protein